MKTRSKTTNNSHATTNYTTDINDIEWEMIKPFLTPVRITGSKRKTDFRDVVNAIFYIARCGCSWDNLPVDFPPKNTVYEWYSRWRDDGTLKMINNHLIEYARIQVGKKKKPSLLIIDSRSIKSVDKKKN